MPLQKDSVYLLSFYGALLVSGFYFYTSIGINAMPIQEYHTYHLILGIVWLLMAAFTHYMLWKIYQKTFKEMDSRQRRGIGVTAIVMLLGLYLAVISVLKMNV